MKIWIDEHLARRLAPWLNTEFGLDAAHVGDLALSAAQDTEIFARARAANAVILTKDFDFVALLDRLGPPPRLIWLTTANASTPFLKRLLAQRMPAVLDTLAAGRVSRGNRLTRALFANAGYPATNRSAAPLLQ